MGSGRVAAGTVRGGFSLLEIMLVLVLIGLLTAGVAVSLSGTGTRAKIRITETRMAEIKRALGQYHMEYSAYPPTLETMQLIRPPILDQDTQITDGWDRKFFYSTPGLNARDYDLISYGPDGQSGSDDDINIWNIKR
ncbi:MAG: type II secretion system protein GspG [Phycisphaeraceae bacterium]|nr:type II secretion system protein GspG [Phycisphaeraceae bacterium]